MTRSICRLAAMTAVVIAAVVVLHSSHAAAPKGKTRAAETKYLMKGIAGSNCGALGKAFKEAAPVDDAGWETLACHASLLNELSYVLMDDGRCPDKTWADASKSLREQSAAVLAAVQAKKFDDAQSAFKLMTGACGACHKEHKK